MAVLVEGRKETRNVICLITSVAAAAAAAADNAEIARRLEAEVGTDGGLRN